MKSMKTTLLLLLILLAPASRVAPVAQTPAAAGVEHFSKEGLSFDYPTGWSVEDKSSDKLQHLIIRRPGSNTLVMVIALRAPLQNVEQIYMSRNTITKPYVESLAQQLGAKVPDAPDQRCLAMGENLVAGYRLEGRIGQEPSTGEVYAVVKGQRLIHLVYIRQDKDEAAGAAVLKSVADTLKAEPPANPLPEAAQMDGIISGGVLNGKALAKPNPDYPPTAKRMRATGTVTVQITVDESGKVSSAQAVSGHPLLHAAAVDAARRAKFSPTFYCGKPIKVKGVITYNFVLM